MLHEILYALLGHTGDVIIFQGNKFIVNPALYAASNGTLPARHQGAGYQVTPNHILSLSEVELINKIVALGAQYRLIK